MLKLWNQGKNRREREPELVKSAGYHSACLHSMHLLPTAAPGLTDMALAPQNSLAGGQEPRGAPARPWRGELPLARDAGLGAGCPSCGSLIWY